MANAEKTLDAEITRDRDVRRDGSEESTQSEQDGEDNPRIAHFDERSRWQCIGEIATDKEDENPSDCHTRE